MNKSDMKILLLCYALMVACALNVLQWQHHRRVTETLSKEIARLQAKASVAEANKGQR